METSRTISNILEHFQKETQELCCQPNTLVNLELSCKETSTTSAFKLSSAFYNVYV